MPDSDDVAVELERRGLYDATSRDAPARLAVLRELLEQGYTFEQLAERGTGAGLPGLLGEAVLWGSGLRVPLREIAARVRLPEETVRYARRLLGLADPGDEPRCHPDEVYVFESLASGIAIFGDERPLQFTRVMGMSAAAIAEGAMTLFASTVRPAMAAAGASETELLEMARTATASYVMVCRAVDVAMRMHFEAAVARYADASPEESEFAIAFVDLVDSTALTSELDADAFADALRTFDRHAAEAAAAHDVRLVKLLGDGAMFAGRQPRNVADAALALLAATHADRRLHSARGGLAFGPVAARDGDYFGRVVNLAARAASVAAPGKLLADDRSAEMLGDRVQPVGAFDLKGFDRPQSLNAVAPTGD